MDPERGTDGWEDYYSHAVAQQLRLIVGIEKLRADKSLQETPRRVARAMLELMSGYNQKPEDFMTVFEEKADEMVIAKNIEFYSMCEHHMLPFFGTAHVAYLPNECRVIGASKLPRLLDMYAKRLSIQERICREVVEALDTHLGCCGAACLIEARHLCMCARGVGKQQSVLVTSKLSGVFKEDAKTRMEFFSLVKG